MRISFTLNNRSTFIECDPMIRLLDILREDFKLTGVKEGCGEGECGACSVIIDGNIVNSCLVSVGALEGAKITTIEGYKETKRYVVLKEAFEEAGAVQCGFCIPGMIMAAEALLSKNKNPAEKDIREAISGNLCRCTGYSMIVDAIKLASKKGDGLW